MDDARAIAGTYADLKFIRTRSVAQIVVEIPIEQADAFVAMFGPPIPSREIPVALARLNPPVGKLEDEPPNATAVPPKKEKKRFSDLPASQQAALRCSDPSFREYLGVLGHSVVTEKDAAGAVRFICGVQSRGEFNPNNLMHDPVSLERWQTLERRYQDYIANRNYSESVR